MQRNGVVVAALVLLVGGAASAAPVNRVVATIDGEPVTQHELDVFVQKTTRGQAVADQAALLEMLITDRLLQLEVIAKGLIVKDSDVDQYIEGIKQRNKIDEAQLAQALQAQGMTLDGYRKQVREEIQKAQLINREIRGKVNVTPEEVERYYQAHIGEYSTSEKMHLRHIVLQLPAGATDEQVKGVMTEADDIYRKAKLGEDFATLAGEYSQDAAAKDGGDLGWMKPSEMLDVFAETVKDMKPDQISRPVRSPVGVHIIKVEAVEGASHTPLDELAAGIKEQLYEAALEARYDKWLTEELQKRHMVELRP